MATALMNREGSIVRVSEMPASKRAREVLGQLQTKRATVEAAIERGRRETNVIARAKARVAESRLELELIQIDADAAEAAAAVEAAREQDSADLQARFVAKKREAIKALVPALRAAREKMVTLQGIENDEHEALGFVDRACWLVLTMSDAGESFLDEWIAGLTVKGLFDEK